MDVRELVLQAVKQRGLALQFASKELRSDLDVVLAAVRADPNALYFAGREVDPSFMEAAADSNLAAVGDTAQVFNVESVTHVETPHIDKLEVLGRLMSGAELRVHLTIDARMEQMAFSVAFAMGNGFDRVHIVLPDHGHVSPLEFNKLVVEMVQCGYVRRKNLWPDHLPGPGQTPQRDLRS